GAVMLGELVGVVPEPLVGRDQFEALVQLPCRGQAGRVVMVEDGEEHRRSLPEALRPPKAFSGLTTLMTIMVREDGVTHPFGIIVFQYPQLRLGGWTPRN